MAEPLRQASGGLIQGIVKRQSAVNFFCWPPHRAVLQLFTVLAFVASLYGNALAGSLNDTGITNCLDGNGVATSGVATDNGSHPRQDCRYGRDAAAAAGMPKVGGGSKGFDFSKIANNGTVLNASAALGTGPTDWACTRDNVTGLIWEVKTTSGLRSQSHTYSWYNSDMNTNGGNEGTAAGGTCATNGRCDTEKFVADANAVGLCGSSDWRMPSQSELVSIVDYGRSNNSIDPTYFPNTPDGFWSASAFALNYSTNAAVNSTAAWIVFFGGGNPVGLLKSYAHRVRIVRAGP